MAGVVGPFQLHRRDPIHCFEYGSSCLLIVEVLWSISFKASFQELARGNIPQSSAPVCTLGHCLKDGELHGLWPPEHLFERQPALQDISLGAAAKSSCSGAREQRAGLGGQVLVDATWRINCEASPECPEATGASLGPSDKPIGTSAMMG